MNKKLKLIAILTITFGSLLVVWANTNLTPTMANTVENNSAVAPPKLFVSNCARCHGSDGKGQTSLGQTLDVPDLTTSGMGVGAIKSIISKGKGSMPAFGKKLKAADITALAGYVRSL